MDCVQGYGQYLRLPSMPGNRSGAPRYSVAALRNPGELETGVGGSRHDATPAGRPGGSPARMSPRSPAAPKRQPPKRYTAVIP